MTHYHDAGKGPERRPGKGYEEGYDNITWWRNFKDDPPGEIAAEVKKFYENGEWVLYWRQLEDE